MITLYCQVLADEPGIAGGRDVTYCVHAGDGIALAVGVSSSLDWVRHDASGFHTHKTLDALYPDGWVVTFPDDWDDPVANADDPDTAKEER